MIDQLKKLSSTQLWLTSVGVSVVATLSLVSVMDILLKGEITYDYIVTGFIASLFVAIFVIGSVSSILNHQRKSEMLLLLQSIAALAPVGVMLVRPHDKKFIYTNRSFNEMMGYVRDELTHQDNSAESWLKDLIAEKSIQEINHSIDKKGKWDGEISSRKKNGITFYSAVHISTLYHQDHGNLWLVYQSDINERKKSALELLENEELFRSVIETIPDAIFLKDAQSRWLIVNEAAKQLFKLHGLPWYKKTEMELADLHPEFYEAHKACLVDDEKAWEAGKLTLFTETVVGDDGKNREFEVRKMPIFDDSGNRKSLVIIGSDITERKKAIEKIAQLAFYDTLTRLPNRQLMLDRLKHALAMSRRSGRNGAILFIDLDHFKTINDSLGHATGDLLLQKVAERLTNCLRETDTIAHSSRFGGDEFVVMLENLSKQETEAVKQAEVVGEKILLALSKPYKLAKHEYQRTASIGVSFFNNQRISHEDLLKQADIAMYHAKKSGRNTIGFFNPQMQDTVNSKVLLERELHKAIDKQQFCLHYQVQVDISKHPIGAEALIRWEHPESGLISPLDFIPLAEESGLILAIGSWVLDTACAQIKAWQKNPLTSHLALSINVSAQQFHQANFVTQIQSAVHQHKIDPTKLKLELTESILLDNIENTVATMNSLKDIGIGFSLDDFGTGYSSLQYLKRLPLHQLKIDQSFVRDISTDNSDNAIVRTIIAMAESLELEVIAEGVETDEQLKLLVNNGCNYFQGYLFGKPLPLEQFESTMKQYN